MEGQARGMKYQVIRDIQEKANYWDFSTSSTCLGTVSESLPTGDYTLRGYEEILSIERKFSTGELAKNVTEARFERELARLDKFPHPYMICEFDFDDLYSFPTRSGIPPRFWSRLKVTNKFLIKRIMEIELDHKVKIIFAGQNGEKRAELIFKYIVQKYGEK